MVRKSALKYFYFFGSSNFPYLYCQKAFKSNIQRSLFGKEYSSITRLNPSFIENTARTGSQANCESTHITYGLLTIKLEYGVLSRILYRCESKYMKTGHNKYFIYFEIR